MQPSPVGASPAPDAAPGGVGASTPALPPPQPLAQPPAALELRRRAAASPAPGAAPDGAGALTPAQPPPPPPAPPPAALGLRRLHLCSRTTRVVLNSSCWSGAMAIRCRHLDSGDVATRRPGRPGVGHTPSKTSRLQSTAFHSSPLPSSTYSLRLCQAPLACAMGYAHIEIICLQNCVNVGIDCDIILGIGEIIGEIMDVIIYDIIDL